MTLDKTGSASVKGEKNAAAARKKRLAEALRSNLQRRKQTKQDAATPAKPQAGDSPSNDT